MNKINTEYKANMLISRFSDLLGGLDAIESSEELGKELRADKLLKRDVKSIVERFTPFLPFLPFLEIISGRVTVGKHVIKHRGVGSETEDTKVLKLLNFHILKRL